MKARLATLSIRYKLGGITIVSMALALGLTYVILSYYERQTYEDLVVRDLPTQAQLTDFNSRAALSFKDAKSARQTLSALDADRRILGAVLYDADGKTFVTYRRKRFDGPMPARAPTVEGLARGPDQLSFVHRIVMEDELLGTLYVTSDLHEVDRMLGRYAALMTGVMILSSILALMLSSGLQRGILGRVQLLANTAAVVSRDRNYAVRVVGGGHDELGQLIESVNQMLGQIQERDAALKANAAELARSNADLEQYAYVASHDLQEPLRVIRSYAQLIAQRYAGKLDADADQFIEYITGSATRMQQLIDDLLAYARLGRDRTFEAVSADESLDGALKNLQAAIEETGARIVREPLPVVRSDATYLTQLFQNLISNALKFHRDVPPEIKISAEQKDGSWVFAVADNGIGIAEDYREKIFALFKRLHSRKKYPGTGIGLGFCQKIVALHGGRIWVTSEPGVGSTFYFNLPAGVT